MQLKQYGILFLLGTIWGASFLFIKVGGTEIPPLTFALGRLGIAALILLAFLRVQGQVMPAGWQYWRIFLVMGFFNGAIPYTLFTWGELYIPSAMAAILNATTPIFTLLLAHLFLADEQITPSRLVGILVGFGGVLVLMLPALMTVGLAGSLLGQLSIVVASASYGVAIVYARLHLRGVSARVAATGQLVGGTLWMLPLSLLVDRPWQLHPSLVAVGALLMLAVIGTAFAYILYYWLMEHIGGTRTSMVTYILPFTGVGWGALVLGERIGWSAMVGLFLIVGGALLVNGALTAWQQRHRSAKVARKG